MAEGVEAKIVADSVTKQQVPYSLNTTLSLSTIAVSIKMHDGVNSLIFLKTGLLDYHLELFHARRVVVGLPTSVTRPARLKVATITYGELETSSRVEPSS